MNMQTGQCPWRCLSCTVGRKVLPVVPQATCTTSLRQLHCDARLSSTISSQPAANHQSNPCHQRVKHRNLQVSAVQDAQTLSSRASDMQDEDDDDDDDDSQSADASDMLRSRHGNNPGLTAAELESLDVLEWPAVSRQVAKLCGTVMAAQRISRGGLPLGTSLQQSQLLQQQTKEALDAGLRVNGIYDLTPALEAVAIEGSYLNARQLEGIAATLQAALDLKQTVEVEGQQGAQLYPGLAQLSAGIDNQEHGTLQAIRHCIKRGSVSDEASEPLAQIRADKRNNAEQLRTYMDELARSLHAKGASDSRSVVLLRDRYCVGIKAGRQSDLPKGSVKLGSSQTGATMYYEPAPAIAMNNAAALLIAREKEEETKVLHLLSRLLDSRSAALYQLLEAATQLDIVAARAAHARVFQAKQPVLVPVKATSTESMTAGHSHAATTAQPPNSVQHSQHEINCHNHTDNSLVTVPWAQHPLLLERSLTEPLPEPPSLDDNRFDRDFGSAPAWEMKRSSITSPDASHTASTSSPAPPPKALDLRLPAGKKVVAITGPNTGGKTVTIKTIGLMALMARAGMFLPVKQQGQDQHGDTPNSLQVAWFSQVLADIGDLQSLQQNLSTFSGHIRRVKQVLSSSDAGSLVLLDEVGSGTDPVEGAALARAILDKLAGRAALTVATTHHAEKRPVVQRISISTGSYNIKLGHSRATPTIEWLPEIANWVILKYQGSQSLRALRACIDILHTELKQVAVEDDRYCNVSMEFDVISLKPTYRLLWGSVGASNALDIARTLGFDSGILKEAQIVARTTFDAQADRAARLAATAASLVKQLEDTEVEVSEAERRREAAEARVSGLKQKLQELTVTNDLLMRAPKQIVRRRDAIKSSLDAAIAAYESGSTTRQDIDKLLGDLEKEISNKIAQANNKTVWSGDLPAPGDRVVVPGKYGEDAQFTIASVQGEVATLAPLGAIGAGLQLLALGSTASRQKQGSTLKATLSEIRVVQRKAAGAAA